mgnify:CR=1 FL=1
MTTIITTLTATSSQSNASTVLGIDLIVILILIGLLIFKEFLKSYFDQSDLIESETKLNIGRIINIAIVPFLYVFSYVLIYRVLLVVK